MPKTTVTIEWDQPEDEYWLNPDNIAIALHAYCKNTKFVVRGVISCPMCSPLPPTLVHARPRPNKTKP